ncbi:MAG: hypothetical protein ACOX2S_07590 [bacterium]
MFTLRDAWREGRAALAQSGVETPQLDSEIIIRYLTCKGREEFYRDLGEPFPAELLARFYQLLRERGRGVPVAYLVGEKEFLAFPLRLPRQSLSRGQKQKYSWRRPWSCGNRATYRFLHEYWISAQEVVL